MIFIHVKKPAIMTKYILSTLVHCQLRQGLANCKEIFLNLKQVWPGNAPDEKYEDWVIDFVTTARGYTIIGTERVKLRRRDTVHDFYQSGILETISWVLTEPDMDISNDFESKSGIGTSYSPTLQFNRSKLAIRDPKRY